MFVSTMQSIDWIVTAPFDCTIIERLKAKNSMQIQVVSW